MTHLNTADFISTITMIGIGLVILAAFGLETSDMNERKGYKGGFWWGFFLTVIGIIVIAIRPFNQNAEKKTNEDSIEALSKQVEQLNKGLEQLIQQQAQYESENQKLLKQIGDLEAANYNLLQQQQMNESNGRRRRNVEG